MESQERRTNQRVRLQASVNLTIDGQLHAVGTNVKDISLDGINICSSEVLPLHRICNIELTITGPSSVLTLTAKGRILRQDTQGAAVQFTELDIDTYMHLKNVILYNRTPDNS